ncbi:MAG: hypothetical protein KAW40_02780 [Candidatus Aenigmarchaeota archaeon]|nr:hypothetical protein [Candidatus Aenigmarchaeota archaeon]
MAGYTPVPELWQLYKATNLDTPLGSIRKVNGTWFLGLYPCNHNEACDPVLEPVNYVDPYGRWALVEGKIVEPKDFGKHYIYV